MKQDKLLIIRHQSQMRQVAQNEPLSVLSDEESKLYREEKEVDMRQFDEDIEGGQWSTSDAFIRDHARSIREFADGNNIARLLHFGIVEVPHLIALGAYLEDARPVEVFDFDRVRNSWAWPTVEGTLLMTSEGKPSEMMSAAGEAVLRVEVTYPIADADVKALVGSDPLCDVRVRPLEGIVLRPGLVQSKRDVETVRIAVREALGAIAEFRPGTRKVHLFVSAPVSVCVAVGQELRLRNTVAFQTYRFRRSEGGFPYKPAILLSHSIVRAAALPLTSEQVAQAAELRKTIELGLEDVKSYAESKRSQAQSGKQWYAHLLPGSALEQIGPFPGLSPIWKHVQSNHALSAEPRREEYEFSKENSAWKMSDHLVLSLFKAADSNVVQLRSLSRLFFFHEYLHDWQHLTKYQATDVGSFFNCLERVDYMADVYALIHQLDLEISMHPDKYTDDREKRDFLRGQIGLMLSSFWAFEPPPPEFEWQERRIRRYLNWYLRRVQMREVQNLSGALHLLSREPKIEVVGYERRLERARVNVVLNKPRVNDVVEVGVVLEDGRFYRSGSNTVLSIEQLMLAFANHDTSAIDAFFNSLFEALNSTGGALPH